LDVWIDRRRRDPACEERIAQVRAAVRHLPRRRGVDLGRRRRRPAHVVSRLLFIAMSPTGLMFLGLTAIIVALTAVLMFSVARIFSAARTTGSRARQGGAEAALLSVALQEAVANLKAQERAMTLRAEASERLSEEIIASLSAGLLVVNLGGEVQIVNPAGRRLLGLDEGPHRGSDYRALLAHAVPVEALMDQCLTSGRAIVRRVVELRVGPTLVC